MILILSVLDVQEIGSLGTENKKEKKTLTHSSLSLSFIRLVNDTGENRREYEKEKRWVFALSLSLSLFILSFSPDMGGEGGKGVLLFSLFLFALFFHTPHVGGPITPNFSSFSCGSAKLSLLSLCENHQHTKL